MNTKVSPNLLVIIAGIVVTTLFVCVFLEGRESRRKEILLAANRKAQSSVSLSTGEFTTGAELSERRALSSFRARMAHAQQLRELAQFPDDEELLKVWDLPEPERERALQVRRERIEEAHRRLDEAQVEEAAARAELKALGLEEP